MSNVDLMPCPCCGCEEDYFTMPSAGDIEYVVCQSCGLRVDADSWNDIPRHLTLPPGYALVPLEPTDEMLEALFYGVSHGDGERETYKAMIKAAEEGK